MRQVGPARRAPADAAPATRYRTITANGLKIFYREAGPPDAPALLLLHGYPASSRMFEPLLTRLAGDCRLIAPDYPGFGHSEAPERGSFTYSFEALAAVILGFTDALGLARYSLYLQDYGGPVGFRLALARPERVRALIVQNAVIHEEGLTPLWEARRAYWAERAPNEAKIREGLCSVQAGIARHVGSRRDLERFDPDLWMDEIAFLRRPGVEAMQLDLIHDYQSNVRAYPEWQAYLREQRPPLLIPWGIHDPIFSTQGAQGLRREQPEAELYLLDAGHFAINDCPDDIAGYVRAFLRPINA
jgi:pimeloyl-ACP methyl ester carboxylesterase